MADENSICAFCKRKIDFNEHDCWGVYGKWFCDRLVYIDMKWEKMINVKIVIKKYSEVL